MTRVITMNVSGLYKITIPWAKNIPHDFYETSEKMKKAVGSQLKPIAVVHREESIHWRKDEFQIAGRKIPCPFWQEDVECFNGYFYGATIGEIVPDCRDMLEEYYAQWWMNAYLTAIRVYLKDVLTKQKSQKEQAFSDGFGPGFYGIPIESIPEFYQLAEAEKIGISLKRNGTLFPVQSCLGMYLAMENPQRIGKRDCKHCLGRGKHCDFCSFNH